MSYKEYKEKMSPLCPVAIKLYQSEVHAPEHTDWGVVTCDGCKAEFAIGPHRIYGARKSVEACVKQFEELLADDHAQKRAHANSYELPD